MIEWEKEDCPFCGDDGKTWQWNTQGGQVYAKCDHKYTKEILITESKQIIRKIAKLKYRRQEIKELLALAKEVK